MTEGKPSSDFSISDKAETVLVKIEQLKHHGQRVWNIPREVGKFLFQKILEIKPQSVLEIGTSVGYSGVIIAEALTHAGGHLYTIESNRLRFDQAAENFTEAGLSNHITQILGHAPHIFVPNSQKPKSLYRKTGLLHRQNCFNPIFKGKTFDLIFLDATKKEHLSFFHALTPYLAPSHTIITDNILSHLKELKSYCDHLKSLPNYQNRSMEIGSGILISTCCI